MSRCCQILPNLSSIIHKLDLFFIWNYLKHHLSKVTFPDVIFRVFISIWHFINAEAQVSRYEIFIHSHRPPIHSFICLSDAVSLLFHWFSWSASLTARQIFLQKLLDEQLNAWSRWGSSCAWYLVFFLRMSCFSVCFIVNESDLHWTDRNITIAVDLWIHKLCFIVKITNIQHYVQNLWFFFFMIPPNSEIHILKIK